MHSFTSPPQTWEDLQIWITFVHSYDGDKWQIIERWIKTFGNPYIVPNKENEEDNEKRLMFQWSLDAVRK